MVGVKVNTAAKNRLISNFSTGSQLQKFINISVIRHLDKYVPSDTTAIRKSVIRNTVFGSGLLIYSIYGNPTGRNTYNDTTSLFQDRPIRGSFWAERWWNGGGRETLELEVMRFMNR